MATSTTNLKVRSGNRVVITFGGTVVGFLQSVRPSDDYSLDAASGIGDARVQEHVPGVARHSISVSQLCLFTGGLREAGIACENSDDALKGRVYDIVVQSKDDGTVLRKYTGCSYASGSVDIGKHAIIIADGQFMALDVGGLGL